MSEVHNQPPREEIGEDLNIPLILMIGLSYALVIVISMVLLASLHHKNVREETERKSVTKEASALEAARAQQAERLGSYEWIEYQTGIVRLPIERAMELATERLGAQKPLGLAPLATAAPALPVDTTEPETEANTNIDVEAGLGDTSTGAVEELEPGA